MKRIISLLAAGLLVAVVAGCGSTKSSAYRDANDEKQVVLNKNSISSFDWVKISEAASNEMLTNPRFNEFLADYKTYAEAKLMEREANGEKLSASQKRNALMPLLMLSEIQNKPTDKRGRPLEPDLDANLLTSRLFETLFNAEKVRITIVAGERMDRYIQDIRELRKDKDFDQKTIAERGTLNAPDLALSGQIIRQSAKVGRKQELSYFFELTLTNLVTGEVAWTYTKEIKRG